MSGPSPCFRGVRSRGGIGRLDSQSEVNDDDRAERIDARTVWKRARDYVFQGATSGPDHLVKSFALERAPPIHDRTEPGGLSVYPSHDLGHAGRRPSRKKGPPERY